MPRNPKTDGRSDHDLLTEIHGRVSRMETDLGTLTTSLSGRFASKDSFEGLRKDHDRLEKIVYGIISIPLVGFLMGLVYLVYGTKK